MTAILGVRPVSLDEGEVLTNLYAGLCRYRRGERLAAMRLIQLHAVDRLLELAERIDPAAPAPRDPFALERRYEQRHPRIAQALPTFAQGYERSLESARAILTFLDEHFEVNPAMRRAILELCASAPLEVKYPPRPRSAAGGVPSQARTPA